LEKQTEPEEQEERTGFSFLIGQNTYSKNKPLCGCIQWSGFATMTTIPKILSYKIRISIYGTLLDWKEIFISPGNPASTVWLAWDGIGRWG